jgi:hypothetical protein
MAPYRAEHNSAIADDAVRIPVQWTGAQGFQPLPASTIRLKFHLMNAKLYAFWTE